MCASDMEQGPKKARGRRPTKNPHAVALGRMGGLKGGRARAEKLTKEQLSEQGRKAVLTRWAKAKRKKVGPNAA